MMFHRNETKWQVVLILFFLVFSPIFVVGLLVGVIWDLARVGFFWGSKVFDQLIDRGECL